MILTLLRSYWGKVDKRAPDDCWPWTGASTFGGYGQIRNGTQARRGTRVLATHVALAIDGRSRPSDDHVAMHRCDNPRCVNPAHLKWGTQAENTADMLAKGRSAAQVAAGEAMDRAAAGLRRPKYLTAEAVRYIRHSDKAVRELGQELGVSKSLVSAVRIGKLYAEVP